MTPHQRGRDADDNVAKGWFLKGSHPDEYEAGITADGGDGKAAAYLRARVASGGFGTIMQQFKADAYRGQRLRLTALVRSEGVERWAGLWMRIDGSGQHSLAFDNMQNRGITGTTNWTPYNVVLDVAERESTLIAFGVLLSGAGQIWMTDVRIEPVGPEVPSTGVPRLRDHPINLDFTQPGAG